MGAPFADAVAAERAFYQAFAACDLQGMSEVWADNRETICIHPGGPLLQGKTAILESWREILSGVLPPRLRHRELRRFAEGMLAVHLVEELIAPHGAPAEEGTRILATNVYRYCGDSWRMMQHHASLPLVGQHPPDPAPIATLH